MKKRKKIKKKKEKKKTNKIQPRKVYLNAILSAIGTTKRPLTAAEISNFFGMHLDTANKYLKILVKDRKVKKKEIKGRNYYY